MKQVYVTMTTLQASLAHYFLKFQTNRYLKEKFVEPTNRRYAHNRLLSLKMMSHALSMQIHDNMESKP